MPGFEARLRRRTSGHERAERHRPVAVRGEADCPFEQLGRARVRVAGRPDDERGTLRLEPNDVAIERYEP